MRATASFDVVLDDAPQTRVVLADKAGGRCNRHVLDEHR
jgi:hypothetical protein